MDREHFDRIRPYPTKAGTITAAVIFTVLPPASLLNLSSGLHSITLKPWGALYSIILARCRWQLSSIEEGRAIFTRGGPHLTASIDLEDWQRLKEAAGDHTAIIHPDRGDYCVFCGATRDEAYLHEIRLPIRLEGHSACDNCAQGQTVCSCCDAGLDLTDRISRFLHT